MADPLVDLVDSAEVNAFLADLGLTAPTDLDKVITGVSASMQEYASRNFVSQAYTRTFDGNGGVRQSLPDYPITAVASLSIDGVSVPAASGVGAGFVFSPTQVMVRNYRFCPGVQNVAITYTAGFNPIPSDLRRAACEAVAAMIAAMEDGDPRIVEAKTGGTTLKYASSADYDRFCLTPNVTGVLEQRKRFVPV